MFHMLSCFNLKPGITAGAFERSLTELDRYLRSLDLVHLTGRIGRRKHHPVMDTDRERNHEYFVIMTFRDEAQCDRSVEYMQSGEEPGNTLHRDLWRQVSDPVFICWEDV